MSMIRKNIYADQDEWETSKVIAQERGWSLAAVIRALLRKWREGEIEVTADDILSTAEAPTPD